VSGGQEVGRGEEGVATIMGARETRGHGAGRLGCTGRLARAWDGAARRRAGTRVPAAWGIRWGARGGACPSVKGEGRHTAGPAATLVGLG
jgi:hypothetical protein